MPKWEAPPEDQLEDLLTRAWQELQHEVADDPPFEAVVGIPLERLMSHAVKAVASMVSAENAPAPTSPEFYIQVYCLAFVVGAKYGEHRHDHHQTSPPG